MDSAPLTKELMDRVLTEVYAQAQSPLMLLVDPKQYRVLEAASKFADRDRRRLKREMNRAWRKQRKIEIAKGPLPSGIYQSSNRWWLNRGSTASPTSENT